MTQRAQDYAFRGGFALLVTLMLLATWNDLTQLGVVRWVARRPAERHHEILPGFAAAEGVAPPRLPRGPSSRSRQALGFPRD